MSDRERPQGARGDGDGRPLRRLGQVAVPHRACPARAASAAASSPSRPASSGSRSSRRRSTRPATACGRRRRSPTSRTRSAATRTPRRRGSHRISAQWPLRREPAGPPARASSMRARARRSLALVVFLVTAGVSVAAEKVDVVVLQNGTRVVGEVRSMKRGKLELKTDDMGTLQIEWGNVVQVTAPGLFEVEDMHGRLRFGTLRPSADGSRLSVVNIQGEEALPLPEVARLQLVKATFWDRISGSLDAGASYTSASELMQLDLDGNLRFRRPKFETSATAEGGPDAPAGRGGHAASLADARLRAAVLERPAHPRAGGARAEPRARVRGAQQLHRRLGEVPGPQHPQRAGGRSGPLPQSRGAGRRRDDDERRGDSWDSATRTSPTTSPTPTSRWER